MDPLGAVKRRNPAPPGQTLQVTGPSFTFAANMANKLTSIFSRRNPLKSFHADHYLRHNARRLEHLASLHLDLAGKSVLEVGAGIGDLSSFYLDRGCKMVITEVRDDNLKVLRERYPQADIRKLDMDNPEPMAGGPFDIVHCYGLLYHLSEPLVALNYMASQCGGMLLLETGASFGDEDEPNPVPERAERHTQSAAGLGCRPTRTWLYNRLKELFGYVYVPTTQPNHDQFPIDWSAPEKHEAPMCRAIFVASKQPIDNPQLSDHLTPQQKRHP